MVDEIAVAKKELEPTKDDLRNRLATMKQQYSAEQIEAMNPTEFAVAANMDEITEDGLQAKLAASLRAADKQKHDDSEIETMIALAKQNFSGSTIEVNQVGNKVILRIVKEL